MIGKDIFWQDEEEEIIKELPKGLREIFENAKLRKTIRKARKNREEKVSHLMTGSKTESEEISEEELNKITNAIGYDDYIEYLDILKYECPDCENQIVEVRDDKGTVGLVCQECYEEMDIVNK